MPVILDNCRPLFGARLLVGSRGGRTRGQQGRTELRAAYAQRGQLRRRGLHQCVGAGVDDERLAQARGRGLHPS